MCWRATDGTTLAGLLARRPCRAGWRWPIYWLCPAQQRMRITTGPRQWVQNGFKVGPEYCRPPAPVAAEWIQAERSCVQDRHLQRLVDGFPGSDTQFASSLRLTGRTRTSASSARGSSRRGRSRRSRSATSCPRRSRRSDRTAGSISIQHAHHRPAGHIGSVESGPAGILQLVLRLQPELGARFLGPHPAEHRVEPTPTSMHRWRITTQALVTLFADVATNYVQYRVAQQRIKIARDNVRIQEGVLALAEEQVPGRHDDRLDVEQATDRPGTDPIDHPRPADPAGPGQRHALYPAGHAAATTWRPILGAGPELGSSADAEHAGLGRRGHPGRPAAPAPRRPQRRAPGGGPERPDRCGRSRPLPHHLHQRHDWLGCRRT